VDAIVPEGVLTPQEAVKWEEINRKYSLIWPNITEEKEPLTDHEDWNGVPNKFEEHFSEAPGTGD